MSWIVDAIGALKPVMEKAMGARCIVGVPDAIAPGTCGILTAEIQVSHALNESGGASDRTATLTAFDCRGVTGSRTGDLQVLADCDEHLDALKAAIEADVTLGGAVQQCRIESSRYYGSPGSENRYEGTNEIRIEVTQW